MVKGTYHNLQQLLHVFFYLQEADTLSRKTCQESPQCTLDCTAAMAIQCKQAPYTAPILSMSGIGSHVYVRPWPHPSSIL
jgi:hypothetical protein